MIHEEGVREKARVFITRVSIFVSNVRAEGGEGLCYGRTSVGNQLLKTVMGHPSPILFVFSLLDKNEGKTVPLLSQGGSPELYPQAAYGPIAINTHLPTDGVPK